MLYCIHVCCIARDVKQHAADYWCEATGLQAQLQRELQKAKQDAREAMDARNQHSEDTQELAENVEMLTLDKEMAEEKAETLQLELDQAKEKIEELTYVAPVQLQQRSGVENLRCWVW